MMPDRDSALLQATKDFAPAFYVPATTNYSTTQDLENSKAYAFMRIEKPALFGREAGSSLAYRDG